MSSSALIFEQFGKLADRCVRKMSKSERDAFVSHYRACYRKHATRGSGVRALKDAKRPIYEVDGRGFDRLWRFVEPYVRVALKSRFGGTFAYELDDDLMEVRYSLFFSLRFYGSRPNGYTMGEILPVIVSSALSKLSQKRFDTERRKTALYTSRISFDNEAYDDFSGNGGAPSRASLPIDDTLVRDSDLLLSIPPEYREVVEKLLGKEFVQPACDEARVFIVKFREDLGKLLFPEKVASLKREKALRVLEDVE